MLPGGAMLCRFVGDSRFLSWPPSDLLSDPEKGQIDWVAVDYDAFVKDLLPCQALVYERAGIPDDLIAD